MRILYFFIAFLISFFFVYKAILLLPIVLHSTESFIYTVLIFLSTHLFFFTLSCAVEATIRFEKYFSEEKMKTGEYNKEIDIIYACPSILTIYRNISLFMTAVFVYIGYVDFPFLMKVGPVYGLIFFPLMWAFFQYQEDKHKEDEE